MKRFSDVTILVEGNKIPFTISWFKKGKSKITKDKYDNYLYSKAFNFGLFYIGWSKECINYKWAIDFSSNIGMLRIINTK